MQKLHSIIALGSLALAGCVSKVTSNSIMVEVNSNIAQTYSTPAFGESPYYLRIKTSKPVKITKTILRTNQSETIISADYKEQFPVAQVGPYAIYKIESIDGQPATGIIVDQDHPVTDEELATKWK